MAFHKATKAQSKLRLALCGLAGSGKTFTALAVGSEIAAEMRRLGHGAGKIALIDTEHESASLYADRFDFDTCPLDNHSPRAYVDTIREAERLGYDIVIVDSLSHAWSGKNGALEQKDNAAARGGNSWTAWRDITPMHNALVDAMLASRCHIIATMRQKMEYIQTTTNGKTVIEKVGLAAIQREGMEYEFTLVGDMDLGHVLRISKTRLDGVIGTGDAFERPGEIFAKKLYGWLMSGAAPVPRPVQPQPEPMAEALDNAATNALLSLGKAETLAELDALIPGLKMLTGDALAAGRRIYSERKAYIMKKIAEQATAVRWSPPADPASLAELEACVPQLRELTDPAAIDEAHIWYNRHRERLERMAVASAQTQVAEAMTARPDPDPTNGSPSSETPAPEAA